MRPSRIALPLFLGAAACGATAPSVRTYVVTDRPPREVPSSDAYEHYLAGELALQAGDDREAVVELRTAAAADDDPFLYLQIAREESKLGRFAGAEDAVATALRLDPEYADAYVLAGALRSAQHDVPGALAMWARAEKADPADAEPYLLRYGALHEAGEVGAAEGELRALVAAVPPSPASGEGHYRLARALLDHGALTEALAEARQARDLAPDRGDALALLGEIDQRLGDLDGALTAYRAAFDKTHDRKWGEREITLLRTLGRLVEARAVAASADDSPVDAVDRVAQARLYLAAAQPERAQALAERVLAVTPGDPEALLADGDARAARDDVPGALAAYGRIPDASPVAVTARRRSAALLLANGSASQAARLLERTARTLPDDAPLLRDLTAAEIAAGDGARALAAAEAAATRHPGDAELALVLAECQARTERAEQAIETARQIAEKRPGDAAAVDLVASLLLSRGAVAEAEPLARRATTIEPGNGALWGTLGRVQLAEGLAGPAVATLRRATRLAPFDPDLLELLGQACAAAHDPPGARDAYRAALAERPAPAQQRRIADELRQLGARRAAR